jgi:glucokinase
MTILAGLDIGGTKCAASLGRVVGDGVELLVRRAFPTPPTPEATLQRLGDALAALIAEHAAPAAIGVSCGGPLSSRLGLVLGPPNLPGWGRVDVISPLRERFGAPAALQNDANACALAEWRWGAGRGCRTMAFLTFGTGMGAGLIIDGRLHSGVSDMAGEIGHVRLERDGPVGYGKAGSVEGFCSGGGIAQLARAMAERALAAGRAPAFCRTPAELEQISAQGVGEAAQAGDALALEVWRIVGEQLGRTLAILVDLLNPERIVIGSIYGRQRAILEPIVLRALQSEALPIALGACEVLPAGLGERVGDYASLSVALHALSGER